MMFITVCMAGTFAAWLRLPPAYQHTLTENLIYISPFWLPTQEEKGRKGEEKVSRGRKGVRNQIAGKKRREEKVSGTKSPGRKGGKKRCQEPNRRFSCTLMAHPWLAALKS
ncbi:MAG: hypothetical protein K2Y37_26415 [Pirellulales bacterium]|nr:hypothetical protein [Pirellulales bacterium]